MNLMTEQEYNDRENPLSYISINEYPSGYIADIGEGSYAYEFSTVYETSQAESFLLVYMSDTDYAQVENYYNTYKSYYENGTPIF